MAQGFAKKGLRRSCNGTHRVAHSTVHHRAGNEHISPVRDALQRAITKPACNHALGRIVVKTMAKHQQSGVEKLGKGWNASLSMRTYQALRVPCGL